MYQLEREHGDGVREDEERLTASRLARCSRLCAKSGNQPAQQHR